MFSFRKAQAVEPKEQNPFEGKKPLVGAEELGRAIVDKNGVPSGSPANYEVLRGSSEDNRDPGIILAHLPERIQSEMLVHTRAMHRFTLWIVVMTVIMSIATLFSLAVALYSLMK